MNVLFLSELFFPHGSGAELATYLYSELLSKSGCNVIVVTNKFDNEPSYSRQGNLSIYRLPLFSSNNCGKYSISLRIDILSSAFLSNKIVWADVIYIPRFWFLAIPLAKLHKKPVVTHLHDYIAICSLTTTFNSSKRKSCKGNRLICPPSCTYCSEQSVRPLKGILASVGFNSTFGTIFSRLIGLSDAIICVSNAHKNIISRSGFLFSHKLNVIQNPVPEYSDSQIKGNGFGYFGGPIKIKGLETIYRAVGSTNYPSPEQFKIYCTKFSNYKEQMPLVDRLQYSGFQLYGRLEKAEYDKLYQKVSTVIVPSIWP